MPKRTDIEKILVIGSGPIIIGQACEFDYSGTQALKALREEGYKVILVNSNPATIMTDPEMAWKTYIEPLTAEYLEKIIEKERPDALLPTLGGQTALNLAVELDKEGIIAKYSIELLGAGIDSIKRAESRDLFKKAMEEIGVPVPSSSVARNIEEAERALKKIGLPLIIRPAFTLGGTGGAVVDSGDDFYRVCKQAFDASPVSEILIEESLKGWKEFELEVMRDHSDNCVVVCTIENIDPMGVHTGDSITVAPSQTLTDRQYQKLRDLSFRIMRKMGVDTGGSNIQFAVNPANGNVFVIEMNPRVSRSSALASKATGFPIAKIAAKLAAGYTLDEIPNDITRKTPACFEPSIDYVVTKIPRFTFEKFQEADQTLGSSMKSVGEVMAIGRTFRESLQKALRSLEIGRYGLAADGKGQVGRVRRLKDPVTAGSRERRDFLEEIKRKLLVPNCDRIFNIKYALDMDMEPKEISRISGIDIWFISRIAELCEMEKKIVRDFPNDPEGVLREAKRYGFSDFQLGYLTGIPEKNIRKKRKKYGIAPAFKAVDTCAAEFESYTPYFYSSYEQEDEIPSGKFRNKKVLIIGGGPNRIGQGIEFDYCICHASFALAEKGYFSIIVNSNPETVSTDYDTSDRLYFEPLTIEDIEAVIEREKPYGAIVQLGGQTPLNLLSGLKDNVRILGTSPDSIDAAEDRVRFTKILEKLNISHPKWGRAENSEEAAAIAEKLGYPVIIRPSYVLGGRAMEVVYSGHEVEKYVTRAADVSQQHPVFLDRFLDGALEIDVDCICDGKDTFVAPLMEHIEKAGIHSGDSACVTPPVTVPEDLQRLIREYSVKIAQALNVRGLLNIQFAVKDGKVYVLEANPRASRTVPFISKSIGIPMAKVAAGVMLGDRLKDYNMEYSQKGFSVKEVVLPFTRFAGTDPVLGPEMKSTGEVMGTADTFSEAFYKAQLGAGNRIKKTGTMLVSLNRGTRDEALPVIREFSRLYSIIATSGTADYLNNKGIPARKIGKLGRGGFDVEEAIKKESMDLIINTPSGRSAFSDGYWIRRWAYEHRIPLITTVAAARALL